MNIDNGEIRPYTESELSLAKAAGARLVEVDASLMTEKQRSNMAVSLQDSRSALGKQLHEARSKYVPHIGAKQLAKANCL